MISAHIGVILVVTGAITALPVFQFFFPHFMLKQLSGVAISDEPGLLFARHWGLVTLTLGALLVYAASSPQARPAIVLAILVEKLGYAGLVLSRWRTLPKMRASGIFDLVCSALYGAYLLGA